MHWWSSYRQLDETPVDYLEPGHGKTKTSYLWVSNIPGGSVFYRWRNGRDKSGGSELFEEADNNSTAGLPSLIQCSHRHQCDGSAPTQRVPKVYPSHGCHTHGKLEFLKPCEPQKSRTIHKRLKKLIDKLAKRRGILPKSHFGKAITYAVNQWRNLETYLTGGWRLTESGGFLDSCVSLLDLFYHSFRNLPKNQRCRVVPDQVFS